MARPLRVAIAVVAAVGLVAAGVFVVEELRREQRYGTEFAVTGPRAAVAVGRGERFSLVVRENASIGDMWSLRQLPAVATAEGDEYVPDGSDQRPGRGGAHRFTFTAREPGAGAIGLYNCYRCLSAASTPESYAVTVEVTVG